jgi:two-component system, OmpR family, response regulator
MAITASAVGAEARALVIEDEGKIARLLARGLKAAGFSVATASSGVRGLALAETGTYDVVILDLMLPDLDGLSILDRLREVGSEARVLVLSALGDVHSKVRCLELGACDYVTKPFDLPELLARVRVRVHTTRAVEAAKRLEQAGFVLDLQRRSVAIGDRTVALSTREFVLLEYLMRHGDGVCTRDELLEHVWGYTFDPTTNVLDVYVARLRQKVGAESIQTVRNVGYAFAGS